MPNCCKKRCKKQKIPFCPRTTRRTIYEDNKCVVKCITTVNCCCKGGNGPTPPFNDYVNFFTTFSNAPYGNFSPVNPWYCKMRYPYLIGNNTDSVLTGSTISDNASSLVPFITKIDAAGNTEASMAGSYTGSSTNSSVAYDIINGVDSLFVIGTLETGTFNFGGMTVTSASDDDNFFVAKVDNDLTAASVLIAADGRYFSTAAISRPSGDDYIAFAGTNNTDGPTMLVTDQTFSTTGESSPTVVSPTGTDIFTRIISSSTVNEYFMSGSFRDDVTFPKEGGGTIALTSTFTDVTIFSPLSNTFVGNGILPTDITSDPHTYNWVNKFTRTDNTSGTSAIEMAQDDSGYLYVAAHYTGTVTYLSTTFTATTMLETLIMKLNPFTGAVMWSAQLKGNNSEYISSGPQILIIGSEVLVSATAKNEAGSLILTNSFGDNSIPLGSYGDTVIAHLDTADGELLSYQLMKTNSNTATNFTNGSTTPGTSFYAPAIDPGLSLGTDESGNVMVSPNLLEEVGVIIDGSLTNTSNVGTNATVGVMSYPVTQS